MALDARARMSTAALLPLFPASVRPSGAIIQEERQAAAWTYSGVLAQSEVPEVEEETAFLTATTFRRQRFRSGTGFGLGMGILAGVWKMVTSFSMTELRRTRFSIG